MRAEHSRVVVDDLKLYLEARLRQVSAKRNWLIRHALRGRDGLSRLLTTAASISTPIERSIRLALNRKNALFAGSDEGGDNWAVIATLIENCKLCGINPHHWLT